MTTTRDRTDLLKNASVVSTLVDAAVAFANGRKRSGLLLLGAAAASTRVPGLGTAVSVVLRVVRRLR
ncbi:hypothetical protein [Natronorubrum aibiense]|uniref:Uncharacterized protein n=1 Tax=Natronorubrum aibiense TaxID=348826 RepID=A0A5P9P680_9EURY|nr:hypothetical protein [Natronorubrum aibiense]QFU83679.1 hypothetical protein GCU68_14595 [Natronorubrum aibiense]